MALRKKKSNSTPRATQDNMLNMALPNPAYQSTLHTVRDTRHDAELRERLRRKKLKKRIIIIVCAVFLLCAVIAVSAGLVFAFYAGVAAGGAIVLTAIVLLISAMIANKS